MNKIILVLGLLLNSLLSYSQSTTCKSTIKEGSFVITGENTSGYQIDRYEGYQIEHFNDDGIIIKSAIQWINESEYLLTVTDRINTPKEWDNLPDQYHFTVTKCNNSIHTIETFFSGKKSALELKKIK